MRRRGKNVALYEPGRQALEGASPASTLISDFYPPELDNVHFSCLGLKVCHNMLWWLENTNIVIIWKE